MMDAIRNLARILGVREEMLLRLDATMAERTGRHGVLRRIAEENQERFRAMLAALEIHGSVEEVEAGLRNAIFEHEKQLTRHLGTLSGRDQFEKAAHLARTIARVGKGFFLTKSRAEDILKKRPPEHLLAFLKYASLEELFAHHEVTEVFSALRFMETDEWMHETFEEAYSGFTADDFEERDIEIKVLGPEWKEVAAKYVAKKHHNVSHLKEFGVIFLNPIAEDMPGKFLRDFALLFHYFHEIEFYSKMFRYYAPRKDFAEKLKMLLRGDVPEKTGVADGEWLIVQRYLFKDDPNDARLFLPRINPESVHWMRGERDLAVFGETRPDMDIELWKNLDWAGGMFEGKDVISLDLEDNAMSAVSLLEGKNEIFTYHQREALWTKLCIEYAGGESEMEKLLIENFDKGIIRF